MSPSPVPAQLQAVLSAAALDALEPDEQRVVDEWIDQDPEARMELAALRRIATRLESPDGPRPEVWTHILAEIGREPAEDRDRSATVIPIARHRRTRHLRRVSVIAAAVAAVAGTAAALTFEHDAPRLAAPPASAAAHQRQGAHQALTAPGAQRASVVADDGTTAEVVVLPSGVGYVLHVVHDTVTRDPSSPPVLYALTRTGSVLVARLDQAVPILFQLPADTTGLALSATPVKLPDAASPTGASPTAPSSTSASTSVGDGSTPSSNGTALPTVGLPVTLPLTLPTLPHLP